MSKAVCERHYTAYEVSQGCEDCKAMRSERVSTGIPEVDAIVAKGLPPGRIPDEVYGSETPSQLSALAKALEKAGWKYVSSKEPARPRLPYSTAGLASRVARSLFPVQEMPPGAVPVYFKEPEPVDMVITMHLEKPLPKGELFIHYAKVRKPEDRVVFFEHGEAKKRR